MTITRMMTEETLTDDGLKYMIQAVAFANGVPCPHEGQYLKDFDFEAHDGRGEGSFTSNMVEAKLFDSPVEAMEYWKTQSKAKPFREDGKPNRPLTALTIMVGRFKL
jgi:hypothetical protein